MERSARNASWIGLSVLPLTLVGGANLARPALADDASAAQAATNLKSGSDLIYGNGGVLYNLSHGGIDQKSLSFRIGSSPAHVGTDFALNASTGVVTMYAPVAPGETIHVSYRYNPDQDKSGAPLQFSYLPAFANDLKLNMVYGTSSNAMNFATNTSQVSGFTLQPKKLGFANLNGMMLMSHQGGNLFDSLRKAKDGRSSFISQFAGDKTATTSDQLYQYSLDSIKVGEGTFGLNYRKVGKNFDFSPVSSQFQSGDQKSLLDKLQKEKGLSTLGFGGDYKFGKTTQSTLGFTQVSNDQSKATKETFGITAKTFNLSYASLKAGSNFSQIGQADLGDTMGVAAGQKKDNLQANFNPNEKVSVHTDMTRLVSANGDSQSTQNHTLSYKASKSTTLSFAHQQAISKLAANAKNAQKIITDSLSLNHQTKDGILIQANAGALSGLQTDGTKVFQRSSLFHLETDAKKPTVLLFERSLDGSALGVMKDSGKASFSTKVAKLVSIQWSDNFLKIHQNQQLTTSYDRKLRIETDAKKPVSLLVDSQETKKIDGAANVIQQIVLNAQVSPALTLKGTDFNNNDGTTKTSGDNLEFTAKPDQKITLNGNLLSQDSSSSGSTDQLNVNVNATAGAVQVAASQHDTDVSSADQKLSETDVSVATPINKDAKVQGTYVNSENKGKNQKNTQSVGLVHRFLGGNFTVEMGSSKYLEGHPFTTYAMGYSTSQDPKLPVRFVTLYRKMGSTDGSQVSEYQYGLDYRTSKNSTLSLKSYQNNSSQNGFLYTITPVRGYGLVLDTTLNSNLKLTCGLNAEKNLSTNAIVRNENFTLKGNLSKRATIDLSYITYIAAQWKKDTPTHSLQFTINRTISDDDKIVFTGDAKYWIDSSASTADSHYVTSRLDFVRTF